MSDINNDNMSTLSIQYLPLTHIETDPHQPRREMEAPDEMNEARTLAGLADSIRQYGLLQPIRVRAIGEQRYRIISGERRFTAATMAGLMTVPAIIANTTDDVLLEQLIENVQRKAMTPLELGDAIQQLIQTGLSSKAIAGRLGLNPMQVTMLSQLQTVSPLIREALEERLIVSPRAAYDLNKLPVSIQTALINQARIKQQVIGQLDVKAARNSLSKPLPPYAPPMMAKTEVAALMTILNQSIENEQYDATQDRQHILGVVGTHTEQTDEQTSTRDHHEVFGTTVTGEERTNSVSTSASQTLSNHDPADLKTMGDVDADRKGNNLVDNPAQHPEVVHETREQPLIVRVPHFTLQAHELARVAQLLGESPPESLTDPGGWLVALLKRKAREY